MSFSTSWVHGNALTIESPVMYAPDNQTEVGRLILTNQGSGAVVSATRGGEVSWCHLPIPTLIPQQGRLQQFELVRVFLLFSIAEGFVDDLEVYDGHHRVAAFHELGRSDQLFHGNYLAINPANTFILPRPYVVRSGINLAFRFMAPSGAYQAFVSVAAAGAEFDTVFPWMGPLHRP